MDYKDKITDIIMKQGLLTHTIREKDSFYFNDVYIPLYYIKSFIERFDGDFSDSVNQDKIKNIFETISKICDKIESYRAKHE